MAKNSQCHFECQYAASFRTLVRNLKPLLLRFLPLVEMTKRQKDKKTKRQAMSCLLFFCRVQRSNRTNLIFLKRE
jgi:hypothetical protein